MVTGAGSGIGRGCALALARAGARVLCVGRTTTTIGETVESIRKTGGDAHACVIDLAKSGSPEAAVESCVRALGGVDIVVNAAGIQKRVWALDATEADWDAMLAVNLKALFFVCQAAARRMREQKSGGSIINITSLTSVIGIRQLALHGSIKGAVGQLTKALAVEWSEIGVRVNSIGPGRIRTPMTESLFANPDVQDSFVRGIPMGRGGAPEDLDGATIFLASDASAYLTGQTIYVDGGWLAAGGLPLK